MPSSKVIVAGGTCEERKANRAPFGKVKDNQCSLHQSKRYAAAVRYFITIANLLFGYVSHDINELDGQISYFIELLGQKASQSGSLAICLVAPVTF